MRRSRLQPIAVAVAVALAACASSRRETDMPTRRYSAPGPGAAQYRSEAEPGEALRGPHAFRVAQAVEEAARTLGDPPQPDARLGQLAQWVLDGLHAGEPVPPSAVLDFWTHHLGLIEPVPEVLAQSTSEPANLQRLLARAARTSLARREITHYGAATTQRDGVAHSVLAFSARRVHLSALPRRIEPTARLQLSGKLAAGLSDPLLVVQFPDGKSTRWGSEGREGFVFEVPADKRGEYRIELLGRSARGPTVLANFPLYVGVQPRASIEVLGSSGERDADAVEERLLTLCNRARADAGLPPVSRREDLDEVARAHSRDMRDNDFIGHTSPTTGGVGDRVKRAGIPHAVTTENVGRDINAEQLHGGLMGSPGHRDNILDPKLTHIGIGVVADPGSSPLAFIATQVFIRPPQEIDEDEAPQRVLEAINRARRGKRLPALSHDETLSEIAARAAERFFADESVSQQAAVKQASGDAARSGGPYERYGAIMLLTFELDDIAGVGAVLDSEARAAGIGVAQGTRPDVAPGRIAVALIFGY